MLIAEREYQGLSSEPLLTVGTSRRRPAADSPRCDRLWVVVPAYNEACRIGLVLDRLLDLGPQIVVVDDASSDGTRQEVLRRPVWLVRHANNLGQGAAIQTGIRFALDRGAEYLATFDADGQHDPEDLQRMLSRLVEEQADYALGSRFLGEAQGLPASRRIVLGLGIVFTRVVSGVQLSDVHNGLRVMTRRGAERLRITMNRMEHASEMIDQVSKSGLKFIEVPVTIRYTPDSLRKGQKSSASFKLGLKVLLEKMSG
jgi:glycosyltransferase involved in cell wall biosynthesis